MKLLLIGLIIGIIIEAFGTMMIYLHSRTPTPYQLRWTPTPYRKSDKKQTEIEKNKEKP